MSTEFLSIISTSPKYVPTADIREVALAAFKKMLPMAESVDVVEHNEICFVDSGMQFELVVCPLCESELDQIWWGDAMNTAETNNFENMTINLPCCNAANTLDNLHYKMPAGFARFLLQAREPKLGKYLAVDKLQVLESILGTPIKQIWAQHKKQGNEQVHVYRPKTSKDASGRR